MVRSRRGRGRRQSVDEGRGATGKRPESSGLGNRGRASRHLDEMKKREKAAGRKSNALVDARRARVDAERALRSQTRADALIGDSLLFLRNWLRWRKRRSGPV